MDINFELYKVFYYVAENLSFTKASKLLFVSQSSVSQSIKQLESKLNVKLFNRDKKNIILTEEGKILFSYVKVSFENLKTAEKRIENYEKNEVFIGASDTLCKYLLLPIFRDFHQSNPDIKIKISNQPSKMTIEDIQNNKLDFGIVNLSSNERYDNINTIHLKEYEEVLVCSKNMYKNFSGKISFDDIKDYPMITLRNNTNTRNFLDNFYKENNRILEPEFEVVSIDLIIELIKTDLGLGFVMSETIKKDEDLRKIDFYPKLPKKNIAIIINKTLPVSNTARLFIGFIKARY